MGILENRRGTTMDTFQILLLVALVAIGAGMGAFDRFIGGQTTADGTPIAGSEQKLKIEGLPSCIGVDKTTVTLSAVDVYDSSVNVNGNHQYKINGGSATTVTNRGTFDASPDDKLFVLWGQGNTSGTVVYLDDFKEYDVPCAGTKTFSSGLYRNGTITSRIFNEEGNLIDTVGENETLETGDVASLRYELQGQFERGQFANGGCATVDYNTTAYDDVIIQFEKGNAKIANPSFATASATTNVLKTYSIPAFVSNELLRGTITLDAKSTINPSQAEDVVINYYPNEHRLNPDKNTFDLFVCGEDQDGNRVSNPIDTESTTLQID